ncbi:MAG: hypothetical protein UZ21_OP11001001142 [Microgenomates bacterium OLB22]|nr:MAG: hypothetical protein UZ21_OP11001001142 [Microgenomates bacterium OLB22]
MSHTSNTELHSDQANDKEWESRRLKVGFRVWGVMMSAVILWTVFQAVPDQWFWGYARSIEFIIMLVSEIIVLAGCWIMRDVILGIKIKHR